LLAGRLLDVFEVLEGAVSRGDAVEEELTAGHEPGA